MSQPAPLPAARLLPVLVPLALIALAPQPAVAETARPARLGLCVACHDADGRGVSADAPHLGGQKAGYLAEQLRRFRDGRREGAPMNALSGALSDADIEALAAWYSGRPAAQETSQ